MYNKVLVPLDGSKLAECTLPHIKNMAKERSLGEVILLDVVEMEIPLAYTDAEHMGIVQDLNLQALWEEKIKKAEIYLADMQAQLRAEGIKAETVLIKGGRIAPSIIDFAKDNSVDLVVIATHGYTGLKKMLLGSVALKVLHESPVPVLLIRPESCRA